MATIKFYLRERLLPPGTPTARNQAEYDESHLVRLRLIRLLTGIGMMSLASVREVLAAIDANCLSPQGLARIVNDRLLAQHPMPEAEGRSLRTARQQTDQFIDAIGWRIAPDARERDTLAQVLAALQGLGCSCQAEAFVPYAEAAERLARSIEDVDPAVPAATVVARTVLFEVAFAVMRRMAYEHRLAARQDDRGDCDPS
ncbi:MerR family transcriptional regulator [Micromonospora sp. R77]|nr:MerR family transcriptional regulator [Micromonospora sp. R77]